MKKPAKAEAARRMRSAARLYAVQALFQMEAADQSADQDKRGHARSTQIEGLREAVHGKRRIGVELAVAGLMRRAGGGHEMLRVVVLGNHAVDARRGFDGGGHRDSSPFAWCGILECSRCFISNTLIMGRKRRNRAMFTRNSPNVPRYSAQSQNVPW